MLPVRCATISLMLLVYYSLLADAMVAPMVMTMVMTVMMTTVVAVAVVVMSMMSTSPTIVLYDWGSVGVRLCNRFLYTLLRCRGTLFV